MITYGKGLVCMPITTELAHKLELHPMVETNEEYLKTAFTVPIDVHPKFFSWMYSLNRKAADTTAFRTVLRYLADGKNYLSFI